MCHLHLIYFLYKATGIMDGGHFYPTACPPTAGDPDVVTCQRWPDISIIIVNRAWWRYKPNKDVSEAKVDVFISLISKDRRTFH